MSPKPWSSSLESPEKSPLGFSRPWNSPWAEFLSYKGKIIEIFLELSWENSSHFFRAAFPPPRPFLTARKELNPKRFQHFTRKDIRGKFQHPEFENSGFSWNFLLEASSLSLCDSSPAVGNFQGFLGWISGKSPFPRGWWALTRIPMEFPRFPHLQEHLDRWDWSPPRETWNSLIFLRRNLLWLSKFLENLLPFHHFRVQEELQIYFFKFFFFLKKTNIQ